MADGPFVEDARNAFLFAIEEIAPPVLEDLAVCVRPAHREATPLARRAWQWHSTAADLRSALDGWAKRWNLDAEWCRETALRTLAEWEMPWEGERQLSWSPRHSGWMQAEPVPGPAPWTPGGGRSPSAVRRELRKWYELQLGHLAAQERAAKAEMLPIERPRFSRAAYLQAVRYQVLGKPFNQIGRGARDPKPISVSVRSILRLIGIPARTPDRGGRPRQKPRTAVLKGPSLS
jgi:hypothetical protein